MNENAGIWMRALVAAHRAVVQIYPKQFRMLFGDELLRVFVHRVTAGALSGFARTGLALYLIADAACSGFAERIRARHERWAWPRHGVSRPQRTLTMTFESIRRDARLALRQFSRAPLFASLMIGSLAFGIGTNSAMFAVVHSVLLEPLPYGDPGELVTIWSDNTKSGERNYPVSPANYEAFKAAPSLSRVEAMYSFLTPLQVRIGQEPESALAAQVTPGMLTLLGRAPLLGRRFDDAGVRDGAVLSYQFWQRRFGADPSVIGRMLTLSGAGQVETIPVLGVMPADFTFPYGSMLGSSGFTRGVIVDLWVPITRERDGGRMVDASGQPNRSIHYFGVIGRKAPAATLAGVRADLDAIAIQRARDYPDTNAGFGATVRPLHEQTVGNLQPALLILLAGVGAVLLITCINVANVLLARAAGRSRDLAVRTALGASRARLMQQSLTESLILSLLGGLAGLGVMVVAIKGIVALAPATLPRIGEVSPSWPVLAFAVALAIVAGVGVGMIPAFSAARSNAQDSLRDGTRTTASRTRRRTRAALIVAEVALAMVLAVGGGLLLRSFVGVLNVNPGFNPDQLLTMQLAVPARHVGTPAILAFYDELEQKLRALPGVRALGGTTRLPLGSTNTSTYLEVDGRPLPRAELPEVEMRRAVFDYFEAMEIPVIRGRTFTRDDHAQQAERAAVVNDVLANRLFRGDDPVGKRVRFASGGPQQPWIRIVGVVGSIRHGSLEEQPKPEIYIYYRQGPPVGPFVVLRTTGEPAQLAAAVRQVVRDMGADPPRDLRTMDAIRSNSVAQRRFMLMLVGCFGVIALGLAALGVFGVVTLIAAERTTEVGIRLALGATPPQVLGLVLGQATRLAIAGILTGGLVSLLLAPVLKAQLFGVSATDPVTYVIVAAVLLATALAGAYIPARKAMRVDPAHALRA